MARGVYAKYRSMLATPVVFANDVPLFSFRVGQPPGWRWDGDARGSYGRCRTRGDVYLGRRADGSVKIGFSTRGPHRLYEQGLSPVLFILAAENRQEKLLHELFAAERVGRELFRGERVEEFVRAARQRSRSCVRDTQLGAYYAAALARNDRRAA